MKQYIAVNRYSWIIGATPASLLISTKLNADVHGPWYTVHMASMARKSISESQWQAAIDAYELGTKHASQVARDLGVSASSVSREFKRRGCIKACRVAESVAALEAALDEKDRRLAPQREAAEVAAAARCARIDRLMGGMMKSLVAAERAGNLSAAGPMIEKIGRSLAA